MNKVASVVVVSLVVALGCKKAANLAKYRERATALAAKYSPKLAELSQRLPELTSHARDLPVNVPGAEKLDKLLAENKSTLEQAQKVLGDLPAKIATDSPEQAEKDLDAADKALAGDVQLAEQDEKEEAAIESTAAAATPPPPPAAPAPAADTKKKK